MRILMIGAGGKEELRIGDVEMGAVVADAVGEVFSPPAIRRSAPPSPVPGAPEPPPVWAPRRAASPEEDGEGRRGRPA